MSSNKYVTLGKKQGILSLSQLTTALRAFVKVLQLTSKNPVMFFLCVVTSLGMVVEAIKSLEKR
jgi:hypothetical protein